ncbi:lectin, putative [Trypanosoma brucei gambiense DAL972]|uniref:Lectin, putative n=2 Tax=Trypanosoma brucei TaxID=5691 RepID=D0A6R0_TRYB9|nr:lectin, putative [Trypanosoma brucei gambiense DAL972]RHW68113.1 mannose-specific lectin [Trypanosoma brucei equiperdum]CBH17361.1 lectin, putative [Trypanosoma brucei gambiense DAL972]|eukprot:XP_011779625.1 lectin, putative [Trypanosoma brucei gambiense DAL972]
MSAIVHQGVSYRMNQKESGGKHTASVYRGVFFPLSQLLLLAIFATVVSPAAASASPKLTGSQMHRTIEKVIEHHSFTPPLLRNYYGGEGLEHWFVGGTAVVTDDHVRLTGNYRDQEGYMWNREALDMPSFEIIVGFHLHGTARYPADGFAIWLTSSPQNATGPLMGHPMDFQGVGVVFDTFDNDGAGNNPAVYVLYNAEGSENREYTTSNDFKNEHVGSCEYAFRQTSAKFSTARLQYKNETLRVYLSNSAEEDETLCTSVSVQLKTDSKDYYIGITAATGGYSDNHDIAFVHTMPIEGEKYDHDVYSRTTPVEESANHHEAVTEENVAKNETNKNQTHEQENATSAESANEGEKPLHEEKVEQHDAEKQEKEHKEEEKQNADKHHEEGKRDEEEHQEAEEREEDKQERRRQPPNPRRKHRSEDQEEENHKGKRTSESKKRSAESTNDEKEVSGTDEEEAAELRHESNRAKGRRASDRRSRRSRDVDRDREEDEATVDEDESEDEYQEGEEEEREDVVRRRKANRQRSASSKRNRKRRSRDRRD